MGVNLSLCDRMVDVVITKETFDLVDLIPCSKVNVTFGGRGLVRLPHPEP
ncbi:MAG: hypothetical protein HC908_01610 [Calothrix sp. SM1_7_51]|nr:hypothetical protein [Calothrix sp. SM1_7_51]